MVCLRRLAAALQQLLAVSIAATLIAECTADSTSDEHGAVTYYEFISGADFKLLPRDVTQAQKHTNPHATLVRRALSTEDADASDTAANHTLRHDDAFRLRFRAYNQTFHLHLRPLTDLLHPDAQLRLHQADGSVQESPLRAEDVRVYTGVVVRPEFSQQRYDEDAVGMVRLRIEEQEHLDQFSNVVGWARILIHDDKSLSLNHPHRLVYEGAFTSDGELYHIMHTATFRRSKRPEDPEIPNLSARAPEHQRSQLIVFRDTDKKIRDPLTGILRMASEVTQPASCGSDHLPFNDRSRSSTLHRAERRQIPLLDHLLSQPSPLHRAVLVRRQAAAQDPASQARASGCPSGRKILYMGAAADCTYVMQYKTQAEARKRILTDWGLASAVYERTFGVQLGLIAIEIRDAACPATPPANEAWNRDCSETYNINSRLSDFSRWRGARSGDGAGLWHLVTRCATGTKIGVAWLGALCQVTAQSQGADVVSGTGVSSITKDGWKVIAHEIGHNFGASHDCTSENCPCTGDACQCCQCDGGCDCGGQYIMNPTSDVKTSDFSPCSIRDICRIYPSVSSCLQDPGSRKVLTVAMCGNGIKEEGEECDCGTEQDCAVDKCCESGTCKFKSGAKCSDRNDDCCSNCQVKAAESVCRPAMSECDIPEKCDGTSALCPQDTHVEDGKACGNATQALKCASGLCTSRDEQCRVRSTPTLRLTSYCPDGSIQDPCSITCQHPQQANTCLMLSGQLLDGTECGMGGKCETGSCKGSSVFNSVASFFKRYPWLPIVLGVLGGLCLLSCLWQICCNRRSKSAAAAAAAASHRAQSPSRQHPFAQTPTRQGNYVDPAPYNGPVHMQPMPPAAQPPRHNDANYYSQWNNRPPGV